MAEHTRSFRTYGSFRESGVDGLGTIPSDWQVIPVRRVCRRVTDGAHVSPDTSREDFPFVSTVDLRNGKIDFDRCLRTSSDSYDYMVKTGCRPEAGDVLFSKDGTVGRTAIVRRSRDFAVASSLIILSPRTKEVESQYLDYWLNSAFIKQEVALMMSGAALRRISVAKVGNLPVALPRPHDQRLVADFLDRETSKIDALVAKKERLIELLREKRTALITHTVTKGLDPNAPMKPSGIDWLGDIPAHWEIGLLTTFADVVDPNPSHRNPQYVDSGFPFISTVEFCGFDDILLETPRRVAEATVVEQERRCGFGPGCIAFSRKGTIGETRILPSDLRFALLDSLCVIKCSGSLNPRYLYAQTKSAMIHDQLGAVVRGAALKQISVGRVRSLRVLVPPRREQDQISEWLDRRLVSLHAALAATQDSVGLLYEYRTALISAAVTGKIDVREEVA